MATSSTLDSRMVATMIFEAWLGEHTEFLEEAPTWADVDEDRKKRRLHTLAAPRTFRYLCQPAAPLTAHFDDPKRDFGPLRQLAAIALSLGSPDELWNAASWLCNKSPSEIGIPEAITAVAGDEPMTEPLSQQELGRLFCCHRNRVKTLVLSKYPHKKVGKKHRLPVKDMSPDYFLETKPWSDSNVKKRKETS